MEEAEPSKENTRRDAGCGRTARLLRGAEEERSASSSWLLCAAR